MDTLVGVHNFTYGGDKKLSETHLFSAIYRG